MLWVFLTGEGPREVRRRGCGYSPGLLLLHWGGKEKPITGEEGLLGEKKVGNVGGREEASYFQTSLITGRTQKNSLRREEAERGGRRSVT